MRSIAADCFYASEALLSIASSRAPAVYHRRRMLRCKQFRAHSISRRLLAAVMLSCYVVATFHFPLPVNRIVAKGERFPCEAHACGCGSADQCWQSCCCFSHEEKLAWAEAQGVTPPASALAKRGASPPQSSPPQSSPPQSSPPRSCCSHSGADRTCEDSPAEAEPHYVSLLQAMECRGLGVKWLSMSDPVDVPPPAARLLVQLESEPLTCCWLPAATAERQQPLVPPG